MEALGSKETPAESTRSSEVTAEAARRITSHARLPRGLLPDGPTHWSCPALLPLLLFLPPQGGPGHLLQPPLGLQLASLRLTSTGRSELCRKEKPQSNGSSRDTSRTSGYHVLAQSKGAGLPTGLSPTWVRPGLPKEWRSWG